MQEWIGEGTGCLKWILEYADDKLVFTIGYSLFPFFTKFIFFMIKKRIFKRKGKLKSYL